MRDLLAGLTLATALLQNPGGPIVGSWESVVRSKTGAGITLELRADGTSSWTVGTMSESSYRVAGHELIIFKEAASESEGEEDEKEGAATEHHYGFRIDGTTLLLMDPKTGREVLRMTRLNSRPGDQSIVGKWSYLYSGRTAYQEFRPDGQVIFRLPGKPETGTYTTSGNSLKLNLNRVTTWNFRLQNGDLLVLKPERGPELSFRRAH